MYNFLLVGYDIIIVCDPCISFAHISRNISFYVNKEFCYFITIVLSYSHLNLDHQYSSTAVDHVKIPPVAIV